MLNFSWLLRNPLNATVFGWTIAMLATALYVTNRNMKLKDPQTCEETCDEKTDS